MDKYVKKNNVLKAQFTLEDLQAQFIGHETSQEVAVS